MIERLKAAAAWVRARAKEPTTMAGVIVLVLIGMGFDANYINAVIAALGFLISGGLIAHPKGE